MANKQVTLILYGADRELWSSGEFKLRIRRPKSNEFEDMKFQSGQQNAIELESNKSTLQLNLDLHFNAGQRYFLLVEARDHGAAFNVLNRRSFIRWEGGAEVERPDTIIRTIMIPNRAKSPDLDGGFDKLQSRGSPLVEKNVGISRDVYGNLGPDAKMALLNIEAKLRATRIAGIPLSKSVTGLRRVEPDRLYVMMQPQIKDVVEESPAFAAALGHKVREDLTLITKEDQKLPGHPDSWKHRKFPVGNLQLSFSRNPINWPDPDSEEERSFSVDADIDLEKGIKHWGEWLRNNVFQPGNKTDQTAVYALLFGQNILPDYTLDPI